MARLADGARDGALNSSARAAVGAVAGWFRPLLRLFLTLAILVDSLAPSTAGMVGKGAGRAGFWLVRRDKPEIQLHRNRDRGVRLEGDEVSGRAWRAWKRGCRYFREVVKVRLFYAAMVLRSLSGQATNVASGRCGVDGTGGMDR